jgi:hypothetical protein
MSGARAAARRLPPSKNRNAMLVGAAGVGLLLVGIGLVVADGDDAEQAEVASGTNVAVTGAVADPLVAFNSPAIVASPTDPETMVVAARVDRPQLGAAVYRSADAGRTWSAVELPLPAGEVRAHAPDLVFDGAGTLFATFHTVSDPENNPTAIWLARSDDGGATFEPATRVSGPFGFQPRVAAGEGGDVHVVFVQASEAVATVRNGFGPPPNPVMAATSSDGGATFGDPVQVSAEERERVGAPVPVVGPGGRLYVLYQDFGDDADDFEGRPNRSVHEGDFALVLARSTDGGESFEEASVVDDAVVPTERFNPYWPKAPSIAVDSSDGAVYVAWADGTNGDSDVFVRRAPAGGGEWTARTQVNEDGSAPEADQYLPVVSVAPGGRVDVAFLDHSGDADNVLAAAALATSFDRGESWRTVVVSDRMFDSRVGPTSPDAGNADPGSRIGLVSRADEALVTWTDTRHGSEDTGRQDVYFAPVRLVPR